MSLQPSFRRVAVAVAFTVLVVVLDYFLSSPDSDPLSLGWSTTLGLLFGYLIWPWFASIEYPPGYFHPTPQRLLQATQVGAGGVLVLAMLPMITGIGGSSIPGLIVAFLFIASFTYVKLGSASRP